MQCNQARHTSLQKLVMQTAVSPTYWCNIIQEALHAKTWLTQNTLSLDSNTLQSDRWQSGLLPTCSLRVRGAVLGAVADEAQGAFLLAITGVHHVHVQTRYARTQRVVCCVAAAALYLGTNALPVTKCSTAWN